MNKEQKLAEVKQCLASGMSQRAMVTHFASLGVYTTQPTLSRYCTDLAMRGETKKYPPRKIPTTRLRPRLVIPLKATAGSVGHDVRASIEQHLDLHPLTPVKVPTGLACRIPPGLWLEVRPRSGLSAEGVVAVPGTIDTDYHGEICVVLINMSRSAYTITPGMRIAQLVAHLVADVSFAAATGRAVVDPNAPALEGERGAGGFGSTGVE